MTILMHRIARSLLVTTAVALLAIGCSLGDQSTPNLAGPSEFGLAVTVTASPNQLPRDGSSQSVVTVTVRDVEGRPVAGQRLMLTLPVNVPSGTRLSSSEVTTDANGQATVVVTAPTQASIGNSIVVSVLPVGGNLDSVVTRQVSITLTPTNTSRPIPSFTFNPASPEIGQLVQFNASATSDEGVACNDTCTYSWDFGGEASATGRIATHRFRAGGRYVVALTVTDSQGATETARQNVDVTTTGQPAVSFTFTPAAPQAGRPVTFTANATAAANHRIVSYNWTWGDGTSSQTTAPSIQHTFSSASTFLVTLSVRDDLGQTSSTSQAVTVGAGLTAEFTNTPAIVGQETTFDASASFAEGGATIELYTWAWGDGSLTQSTRDKTITHVFAVAGDYTVTLTITDSQGRTAQRQRTVTVAPAP